LQKKKRQELCLQCRSLHVYS